MGQMLTWLADVLRDAGCTVVEENGWKTRGRDGSFAPRAVMLHHDASPPGETSNGVDVIRDGRDDLPGPLAQLWLDYHGVWHVVAAGRANHGGEGGPWGTVREDMANADAIGIETDHTSDEEWTGGQRSEGIKGVAAICRKLGITTLAEINDAVLAHKEYTSRKIDPDPLDMDVARDNLYEYMTGGNGVLGMTQVDKFSNSTEQRFTGSSGRFSTVTVTDDGGLSLLVGPVPAYTLHAAMTIRPSGSNPIEYGDIVQARFAAVIDYEGSKDTVIDQNYPVHEIPVSGGDTFANLSWSNTLGDTDDDNSHKKVRLFIQPPDGKTLSVVKVAARALH